MSHSATLDLQNTYKNIWSLLGVTFGYTALAKYIQKYMVLGGCNILPHCTCKTQPKHIVPAGCNIICCTRHRSGNVTLLDTKTLYIPNLHYDGSAPDAFFWVGKGKPDRTGIKIPNEKKRSVQIIP